MKVTLCNNLCPCITTTWMIRVLPLSYLSSMEMGETISHLANNQCTTLNLVISSVLTVIVHIITALKRFHLAKVK